MSTHSPSPKAILACSVPSTYGGRGARPYSKIRNSEANGWGWAAQKGRESGRRGLSCPRTSISLLLQTPGHSLPYPHPSPSASALKLCSPSRPGAAAWPSLKHPHPRQAPPLSKLLCTESSGIPAPCPLPAPAGQFLRTQALICRIGVSASPQRPTGLHHGDCVPTSSVNDKILPVSALWAGNMGAEPRASQSFMG